MEVRVSFFRFGSRIPQGFCGSSRRGGCYQSESLYQAGYFFHHLWNTVPENLEFYARQAFYLPDMDASNQLQNEVSFGCNWFAFAHRLKLTGEASHLSSDFAAQETIEGWRYRLQLDVSF